MTGLRAYQKDAVEFLKANPKAYLALDMGLGKTLSVLSALDTFPVLVHAPKRVAEYTWAEEIEKWTPHLTYGVAKGTAAQRNRVLQGNFDITIVGRDNLGSVPAKYNTIVVDEASGLKSKSTRRWKETARLARDAEKVILMSGTPAAQGLEDLWAPMFLLDGGKRLGKTLGAFRSRYMDPAYTLPNGVVAKWNLKPGAKEAIFKAVEDIMFTVDSATVLDLPESVVTEVTTAMPKDARKAYKDLRDELVTEYGDEQIAALDPATVSQKLGQLANGFLYNDDGETRLYHTEKVKAVRELVDEADSPVLVWITYKADLAALRKEFPGLVYASEKDAVPRWNKGRIPVMAAHPASVGHGVNLQSGGHTEVYYSLPWSLEQYQQSRKRLHRSGQTHTVLTYILMAEGTIDKAKLRVLEQKAEGQQALLDHIKENL